MDASLFTRRLECRQQAAVNWALNLTGAIRHSSLVSFRKHCIKFYCNFRRRPMISCSITSSQHYLCPTRDKLLAALVPVATLESRSSWRYTRCLANWFVHPLLLLEARGIIAQTTRNCFYFATKLAQSTSSAQYRRRDIHSVRVNGGMNCVGGRYFDLENSFMKYDHAR